MGHYVEGAIEHRIGAEAFALGYVHRLHPLRIALLPPVDEAALPAEKTALGIVGSLQVILEAAADNRVDLTQPSIVSCLKENLPGCNGPDFAVGRARPGAAGAGVLDDSALPVNLLHKTGLHHFRFKMGKGEYGAV